MDNIEREYIVAIDGAGGRGENDLAIELVTGLREYRELFQAMLSSTSDMDRQSIR